MVILSMLLMMMVVVLDQTSNAWNNAERKSGALREARSALLIMARDFRAMAHNNSGSTILFNPSANEVEIAEPVAPMTTNDRIFFLSLQSDSAQTTADASDLCMVGYYLAYTVDGNAPGSGSSYKLYRHYQTSSHTVPHMVTLAHTPAGQSWATASYTTDEMLAKNIIDLQVDLFRRNETGRLELLEAGMDWPTDETPALVQISFKALGEHGARALSSQTDWHNDSPLLHVITQNSQPFTTRIRPGGGG